MNKVYLSLGTNMGNRLGYLNRACEMIEDSVYVFSVKKSKIYETKAWGYTEQPDFLNICLEVDTSFDPHEMLKFCQNIETRLNRKRIIKWGPRTIDVDVLLYNNEVIDTEDLKVPHPLMKERAFVLRPLLDLSKELDINGENVLEAFNRLPDEEKRNIEEFEIDENNPFSQQKKIIVNREKGIEFGKDNIVIAGPCAIESYEQFLKTAEFVKSKGADILRGGAYKPRTSSFSFNGLKEEGLEILKEVRKKTKMPVITELMDIRDLEKVYDSTDIIQIGSRNMQNFPLLSEAGKQDKPVMLKRGLAATINEWICSAEYIAVEGNEKIIMCERGIRTYDDYTRNTLDLAAVPIIKKETGLPVIVDPSHGTGIRELVAPMSYAALACGADGIMVEVHPNPDEALSDGEQSLDFDNFEELMEKIKKNYKNL